MGKVGGLSVYQGTPILRRLGVSTLLGAIFVSALATSAYAGNGVPLKGSFSETFVIVAPPPVIVADASGSGQLTHLGKSTESFVGTVDFTQIDPRTGCAIDSAVGTIIAANGDQVSVTAAGEFCPATGVDSGSFTITGGTGRFANATGGGAYTSVANFASGTSSEQYDGSISY